MSAAFSVAARLRHSLLLTFSPHYRQVRQRLDALSRPAT